MTKRTKNQSMHQLFQQQQAKNQKRLRGKKCKGKCEIHDMKCDVVLKYKDKKIQATMERLQAISGVPIHDDNSSHYCNLCRMAIRENRPLDAFAMNDDGTIYIANGGKSRLVEVDGELIDTTFEKE